MRYSFHSQEKVDPIDIFSPFSARSPLWAGQGDCDRDSDCRPKHYCGVDNCKEGLNVKDCCVFGRSRNESSMGKCQKCKEWHRKALGSSCVSALGFLLPFLELFLLLTFLPLHFLLENFNLTFATIFTRMLC